MLYVEIYIRKWLGFNIYREVLGGYCMGGKFKWTKFENCDINDPFFNSLKQDYPEFPQWFMKKSKNGESALVCEDEKGLCAFLYLKEEKEPIELVDRILPSKKRMKIGTLKLDERIQGQRLGEGAVGVALWRWQESEAEEIYLTVFPKHTLLIELIEKFGFTYMGRNKKGENVYLKSKKSINYSDPFKAFPFLNPCFKKAGYIPIYDYYHDTLFPYSELYNTKQEVEEKAAANGITKVFIGFPVSNLHHKVGEPVIIYRIDTKAEKNKQYKSVATSFCTLTNLTIIKSDNIPNIDLDKFIKLAGNKTVYSPEELEQFFYEKKNIVLIEMVYNGFFGKGKNITFKELNEKGLFNDYPYNIVLSREQFISILEMGGKDVSNIIIDKT
ncbi:MAG TPA: hypothetical protein GX516_04245 [Thermoanaerobacter sp.]|nr:hypothetical protein [Thermoanaerobacter sp.]